MKSIIKSSAWGGALLMASLSSAFAGSELQPGITTGLALGVPLPPGVYDVVFADYGSRSEPGASLDTLVIVPSWLIWSTPWTIGGGRIILDTSTAFINLDQGSVHLASLANTLIEGQIKWDLGGGFFGGFQSGIWIPNKASLGRDYTGYSAAAALSYVADGWNLSVTAVFGTGDNKQNYPDWLNCDLSATKKFGKWEIGAVAFGSTDLDKPNAAYLQQNQFAMGGLIGYDFDVIDLQVKVTSDLTEQNYGGKDARAWLTAIIPLVVAPKTAPVK